jgi:hypothetical protein
MSRKLFKEKILTAEYGGGSTHPLYEVICPICGKKVEVTGAKIISGGGKIICPKGHKFVPERFIPKSTKERIATAAQKYPVDASYYIEPIEDMITILDYREGEDYNEYLIEYLTDKSQEWVDEEVLEEALRPIPPVPPLFSLNKLQNKTKVAGEQEELFEEFKKEPVVRTPVHFREDWKQVYETGDKYLLYDRSGLISLITKYIVSADGDLYREEELSFLPEFVLRNKIWGKHVPAEFYTFEKKASFGVCVIAQEPTTEKPKSRRRITPSWEPEKGTPKVKRGIEWVSTKDERLIDEVLSYFRNQSYGPEAIDAVPLEGSPGVYGFRLFKELIPALQTVVEQLQKYGWPIALGKEPPETEDQFARTLIVSYPFESKVLEEKRESPLISEIESYFTRMYGPESFKIESTYTEEGRIVVKYQVTDEIGDKMREAIRGLREKGWDVRLEKDQKIKVKTK